MPRKAKDEEVKKATKRNKKSNIVEVEEKSTSIKKAKKPTKTNTSKSSKKVATGKEIATKTATSKKATTKKTVAKKETSTKSKTSTSKASFSKSAAKKSTTSKKSTAKTSTKRTVTKKTSAKNPTTQNKVATKKASSTKKDTAKKTSTKKTSTKRTSTKKAKAVTTPEYYDLPATYNRTIVKILAQTPSSLFVYWEVSEDDRKKLQEQYGEEFFQNTKPYLVITNETMNYSFEIEINDYANSWYIPIHDSSCKYGVQLIRKPIHHNISTVVNIISSNEIATPNDHILFDKLGKTVFFRDVKSNYEVEKDISSLSFISNIGRVYNIYDLYKEIYKNELNGDELGVGLSSSGFSSNFI